MFRIPLPVLIFLAKAIAIALSKEIPPVPPSRNVFIGRESSKIQDLGIKHRKVSEDAETSEDKIAILEKKLESLLSFMPPIETNKDTDHDLTRRQKRDFDPAGATLPEQGIMGLECGHGAPYFAGYPLLCPCAMVGYPQQGLYSRQKQDSGCQSSNDQTHRGPKGEETIAATYVRWGRSDCPETAQKIYDGLVGGSWTAEKGNGGNYLCLPNNPTYGPAVSGGQSERSRIRSVELHASNIPFIPHIESGEKHELVCVVCGVTSRSAVLTVPATNTCPSEAWTFEYTGFLAAEKFNNHGRSEYICIDGQPQGVPGTSEESPGGNLYITETTCVSGGLPCGPYVHGYELPCVVCTI